tara:strand:+ start:226 stop:411 length:186 start_codon:yes stop_codon:yes gene_type:complete
MQDNDGNTVYSKAHVDELKNTNIQWLTDALNLDDFKEKSNEEYVILKKYELLDEIKYGTGV